MQLRIHVGTLTAFFAPSLRRDAEHHGEPPPDDAAVRDRVEAWRAWVSAGLERAGHLPRPLHWDERDAHAPEAIELEHRSLQALKLWLAYDGHGVPPRELPDRPERDHRWTELAASDFAESAWDQILVPELWLPGDLPFTFLCPYPDGHEVHAGWVDGLRNQLAALHEQKFGATPIDARLAASADTSQTRDVGTLARHAAGLLAGMATRASSRGLPMLLYPA